MLEIVCNESGGCICVCRALARGRSDQSESPKVLTTFACGLGESLDPRADGFDEEFDRTGRLVVGLGDLIA